MYPKSQVPPGLPHDRLPAHNLQPQQQLQSLQFPNHLMKRHTHTSYFLIKSWLALSWLFVLGIHNSTFFAPITNHIQSAAVQSSHYGFWEGDVVCFPLSPAWPLKIIIASASARKVELLKLQVLVRIVFILHWTGNRMKVERFGYKLFRNSADMFLCLIRVIQ